MGDELTRRDTNETDTGVISIVLDLVRERNVTIPVSTGNVRVQGSLLLNDGIEDVLIAINNSAQPETAHIQFNGNPYRHVHDILEEQIPELLGSVLPAQFEPFQVKVFLLRRNETCLNRAFFVERQSLTDGLKTQLDCPFD